MSNSTTTKEDVFYANCGEFMEKLQQVGHSLVGDIDDGLVEDIDFLPASWSNDSPVFLVRCKRCSIWYGLSDEDSVPLYVPTCPYAKEASRAE